LEFVWSKIYEKHMTLAGAFRFFDIRNAGYLTKADFIRGLETLKIILTSSDLSQVFDYLDVSKDGVLDYGEFCNLCEERRLNIDPYINQLPTMTHYEGKDLNSK
jgi:Ca2+-binding EF-hand superfamily protein